MIVGERERERNRVRERFVERILLILYFLRQRNISIIIHNVCAFLKGTYDSMYITHTSVVGQTSLPFLQQYIHLHHHCVLLLLCMQKLQNNNKCNAHRQQHKEGEVHIVRGMMNLPHFNTSYGVVLYNKHVGYTQRRLTRRRCRLLLSTL